MPHYTQAHLKRQGSLREVLVRYVKGVGPERMGKLARLDIETVEDLLCYVPRRYEDRSRFAAVNQLMPGQSATIRGRILAKGIRRTRGGTTIVELALGDGTGIVHALWFHQPYLAGQFRVGDDVVVYGRIEPGSRRALVHPEVERLDGTEEPSLHLGRIVPVYPLAASIGQRWFRRIVHHALETYLDDVEETLPESLRKRHELPERAWALRQIHFPESWQALDRATRRLAFEELFLLQLALALRRARATAHQKPQRYRLDGRLTQAFLRQLPFTLTASQRTVLDELLADLASPFPMQRLLQGDVGCGKTVVAAYLIAAAVQSGYQAALMAPTEPLAEQHARRLSELFAPLGIRVGLLSHGIAEATRKPLAEAIAKGTIPVVVGTHALIQTRVRFASLALVIIDEQHKFGVVQRSRLAHKAAVPDVLVMTATPIPRTMALTIYGDLASSTIRELPPGRLPVRTLWLSESERQDAYRMIREELRRGHQAYGVYPVVEHQPQRDLKAATQMAATLRDSFPEWTVGLLHGKMRPREKERIMRQFAEGTIRLLVSTVIVEVGLDVPNATIMVIEHGERFGLAQLHQLRGRIGRSHHPAACVVISDTDEAVARRRLEAFTATQDGFQIAEQDLKLRGPGELLGRRQSGFLRFRVADLLRDRELLESARQIAVKTAAQDPGLHDPAWAPLKARLASARHASKTS